jgi:hypothetical protein
MDIRTAARPGRHRLAYLAAALAGVTAGLAIGLAARAIPSRIPADARVVTVTPVFDYGSSTSPETPDAAFTITDPAKVAKIAALISGLRQLPAGLYGCPSEADDPMLLTSMQLTFRTALGGPVVATADADYAGCQFAWLTVGTQTLAPLDENTGSGQPPQQQVLAIARVSWPYTPG